MGNTESDNSEKNQSEGDFLDDLGRFVDNASAVYTGVEYAKNKSKYRPNSNSFVDYLDGVNAYKDIRNNTFNEKEFEKKATEDRECKIF